MLESVKRLFSKEGTPGFEKVRERVKDLVGRLAKGEEKRDNTEILGILSEYGAEVAPYRVVSSKGELREAVEELGCPVMVKPVTTRVITRSQANAVIMVESVEDAGRAYAQVIGRIVSSTPWIGVTGLMVQERVEGDEKLVLSWERKKKRSFPFQWVKRLFKGGEEKGESKVEVSSRQHLMERLGEEDPDLQGVLSACHLAWVETLELSAMEVEVVFGGGATKVVDARISVFG